MDIKTWFLFLSYEQKPYIVYNMSPKEEPLEVICPISIAI